MSASLVGSEMCIRDRQCLRGSWRGLRATSVAARRADLFTGAALARPQAVSYTHLTLPTICSV
eukprot:5937648-Alexandrium_andersonii.AAC.1